MTERLGTNEARRRQLLADVAHELRTPLSVIQANLEALIDGLYPIDEAHLRLGPRGDEGDVAAAGRPADAVDRRGGRAHVASRADRATPADRHRRRTRSRPRRSEAGVRLETRGGDTLPEIEVDRLRIGEVLSNLLSNALRHTPAGGEVIVDAPLPPATASSSRSPTPVPGSRTEQLPHVFDRFSRAPRLAGRRPRSRDREDAGRGPRRPDPRGERTRPARRSRSRSPCARRSRVRRAALEAAEADRRRRRTTSRRSCRTTRPSPSARCSASSRRS